MTQPPHPAGRAALAYGQTVTGGLALLGILGLLRTGIGGEAASLFMITLHPLSSFAYLLIGLVGIPLLTCAGAPPRFALVIGVLLLLWAIASLSLGGSPSEAFSSDREFVALNAILGVAGIVVGTAERWLPTRKAEPSPGDAA